MLGKRQFVSSLVHNQVKIGFQIKLQLWLGQVGKYEIEYGTGDFLRKLSNSSQPR